MKFLPATCRDRVQKRRQQTPDTPCGPRPNIDGIEVRHRSKRRLSAGRQQYGLIESDSVSWNSDQDAGAGRRLPVALDQASSRRALVCALLPACPKPPPFLEVFVYDVGLRGTRKVFDILRQTGGTLILFA